MIGKLDKNDTTDITSIDNILLFILKDSLNKSIKKVIVKDKIKPVL